MLTLRKIALFCVSWAMLTIATAEETKVIELDSLIVNPEPYLGQRIGIKGVVDQLDVYDAKKDLTILSLQIRNPSSKAIFTPPPMHKNTFRFVGVFTNALSTLDQSMQNDMSLSGDLKDELANLSLDFKASVGKTRSMATYYKRSNNKDIADAINELADSYDHLGDAYNTFSQASAYNFNLQTASAEIRFNAETTNKSSNAIMDAGKLFLQAIYLLKAQNGRLSDSFAPYDPDKLPMKAAYSFIMFGHELDANAWQYRKLKKDNHEKNARILSKAYLKAGESVLKLTSGLHKLGKALQVRMQGRETPRALYPHFRCAYYGYNQTYLRETAKKLNRLGNKFEVTLWGELIRQNLQAETDITWIQIDSIEIDGLIIPISHEDKNPTLKDAMDFYNWASGKE